jgi:hypothetical protein
LAMMRSALNNPVHDGLFAAGCEMPKNARECQGISFYFKGIHFACVGLHEYSNEPAETKRPNVYVDWPGAAHGGSRVGIAERGRL